MDRVAYVIQIGDKFIGHKTYSFSDGTQHKLTTFKSARLFNTYRAAENCTGYTEKAQIKPVDIHLDTWAGVK